MTSASPNAIDVLIVGAGLSGIGAAHHLETTAPWASYTILEARDAIGGTWDLFRYPGIRSDSDMFTFGYSLRPWDRDNSIGDGPDIKRYIEETAREAGVDKHIRFGHKVLSAEWSTSAAQWLVTAENVETGERVEITAKFLFSCTGYYRYDRGHTPEFEGRDDFVGTIVHPQHWPDDLDYTGKRAVVIGSGATAVTLIPSMADDVEKITMLQRSPSYIAAAPKVSPITRLLRKVVPESRSGNVIRWVNALQSQAFFSWCQRRPKAARRLLMAGTKRLLPDGFDVDKHFTPKYNPWDQRLCLAPEGDFFKSIRSGKADVVTDRIERFTAGGILLESGQELEADIIVTATGLELLFLGGIEVVVDQEKLDLTKHLTYKGMMLEGVPNLALAVGYTNASWTLKSDLTADYVARLLNEMRRRNQAIVTPRNTDPAQSESGEALLNLTSGYIQRSAHLFPRQGVSSPWRVHQRYLTDYKAIKREDVIGDDLVLTNPPPTSTEREGTAHALT